MQPRGPAVQVEDVAHGGVGSLLHGRGRHVADGDACGHEVRGAVTRTVLASRRCPRMLGDKCRLPAPCRVGKPPTGPGGRQGGGQEERGCLGGCPRLLLPLLNHLPLDLLERGLGQATPPRALPSPHPTPSHPAPPSSACDKMLRQGQEIVQGRPSDNRAGGPVTLGKKAAA